MAVAISAALVSAPMAFGAGDPVANGTFSIKLSGGFKNQLKRNHVRMKPKQFKIQPSGSNLDPTTGAGVLKLGKITFKKGNNKYVLKNVKATLGASGGKGNIAGSAKGNRVKVFSLKGGTLARLDFGATLTNAKAKFLKGAAKKLNKALELNSLHPGKAGKASAYEQPKTVGVTGGTVLIDIPVSYLPDSPILGPNTDPNTVAAKQPSHCIDPVNGVRAILPGQLASALSGNPAVGPLPAGIGARFKFPVTGGTIGPAGNAGAFSVAGGIQLRTGAPFQLAAMDVFPQPASCAGETAGDTTSHSILETINLAPNLALGNVQSNVKFGGTQPGCNKDLETSTCPTAVFAGDKGTAIGQAIDLSGITVGADPAAKTVTIAGGLIKNNGLSALTLGGLFPDASGTHPWADGDKFGFAKVTVNTR
jgi:hypothetical protein